MCLYSTGLRCNGIDEGCCTTNDPCKEGDGDCDNNNECAGSLICGEDNCPWGDGDDCCRKGCCIIGIYCLHILQSSRYLKINE